MLRSEVSASVSAASIRGGCASSPGAIRLHQTNRCGASEPKIGVGAAWLAWMGNRAILFGADTLKIDGTILHCSTMYWDAIAHLYWLIVLRGGLVKKAAVAYAVVSLYTGGLLHSGNRPE